MDVLLLGMAGYAAFVALLAFAFWLTVRRRRERAWDDWFRRQRARNWAWRSLFDRMGQRRLTHRPPGDD